MSIELTTAAAQRVQAMLGKRGHGLGLRLGTRKSGCSGFAYVVDYADEISANDKVFEAHIYPGVNHGFHNDSTPRYDEAAARIDGMLAAMPSTVSGGRPSIMGVWKRPGAMLTTRMPVLANSRAAGSAMAAIAPLEAA